VQQDRSSRGHRQLDYCLPVEMLGPCSVMIFLDEAFSLLGPMMYDEEKVSTDVFSG
jgi:hypothetical protein